MYGNSAQIETGNASSPTDGSKHKKRTMFIWKTAMSDGQCKKLSLQSPEQTNKQTNCFTSCVDERAIGNMRLRPSRKVICLRLGNDWRTGLSFFLCRQAFPPVRLFSPTVMWPKRARTPLLCVSY